MRASEGNLILVEPRPGFERLHDVLLFGLIVVRMLSFGLDGWSQAQGVVFTGTIAGLALLTMQSLRQQGRLRWCAELLLGLLVVATCVPACLQAGDPALAWGRWANWAVNLLLGVYLFQIVEGRQQILWAALLGSATVQCGLVLMQHWHVHPLLLATMDDSTALAADARERLRNGGAYGSFDLANSLANHLILILPVVIATILGQRRQLGRLLPGALLALALLASLALSGSKAAPLALAGAALILWARHGRLWRWLLVICAPLGAFIPGLWDRVADSVTVRLGYWQGAWEMVLERPLIGWGLDGFAIHGPAHAPLWAEPTHHVHNALLGTWVAGGAVLLLPLVSLLLIGIHRCCQRSGTRGEPIAHPLWLGLLPLVLLPYLVLLGELSSDNLALWPGGDQLLVRLAYAVALGLPASGIAIWALRLPAPPKVAVAIGLLGAGFQWLVDYSLLNAAVVGGATAAACCLIPGPARHVLTSRSTRIIAILCLPVLLILLLWFQFRASTMRQVDDQLSGLDQFRHQPNAALANELTAAAGLPPPPDQFDDPQLVQGVADAVAQRCFADSQAGPWSLRQARASIDHMAPGTALEAMAILRERLPDAPGLLVQAASLHQRLGQTRDARLALEQAIAAAPAVLSYRFHLWLLLRPGPEREALAREIRSLQDQVHGRNRLTAEQLARLSAD